MNLGSPPKNMYLGILQDLGLTPNEAKIYQTLIEEGESAAGEISTKGKIHRRNVYDTIDRLVEKGLVFQILEKGENVYKAVDPAKLLEIVKEKSEKAKLTNVETILSDSQTGLVDESIDVVWLCDVLHEIKERKMVLEELHRVLKNEGVLAIHDGMGKKALAFTKELFSLAQEEKNFLLFTKNERYW